MSLWDIQADPEENGLVGQKLKRGNWWLSRSRSLHGKHFKLTPSWPQGSEFNVLAPRDEGSMLEEESPRVRG